MTTRTTAKRTIPRQITLGGRKREGEREFHPEEEMAAKWYTGSLSDAEKLDSKEFSYFLN